MRSEKKYTTFLQTRLENPPIPVSLRNERSLCRNLNIPCIPFHTDAKSIIHFVSLIELKEFTTDKLCLLLP